ncbi:MAG: hypothetical protein GY738_09665, partial [Pseudoalteromonas sp.]|nr:hypothetical protein [Pseudoalteromonas sp.]
MTTSPNNNVLINLNPSGGGSPPPPTQPNQNENPLEEDPSACPKETTDESQNSVKPPTQTGEEEEADPQNALEDSAESTTKQVDETKSTSHSENSEYDDAQDGGTKDVEQSQRKTKRVKVQKRPHSPIEDGVQDTTSPATNMPMSKYLEFVRDLYYIDTSLLPVKDEWKVFEVKRMRAQNVPFVESFFDIGQVEGQILTFKLYEKLLRSIPLWWKLQYADELPTTEQL